MWFLNRTQYFYLEWPLTRLLFIALFQQNWWSAIRVVISARLNVTKALRHRITNLWFTRQIFFFKQLLMLIIIPVSSHRHCCEYTHACGHAHYHLVRTGSSFHTSFLLARSWLTGRNFGGGDSSVVKAPDSRLKGRGFESQQEWREYFLLRDQLSVLTFISVSVPPPCYHSST